MFFVWVTYRIFTNQISVVKIPPISSCFPVSLLSKIKHQLFIQSTLIFWGEKYIYIERERVFFFKHFRMRHTQWILLTGGSSSIRNLLMEARKNTSQIFFSSYERERINTSVFSKWCSSLLMSRFYLNSEINSSTDATSIKHSDISAWSSIPTIIYMFLSYSAKSHTPLHVPVLVWLTSTLLRAQWLSHLFNHEFTKTTPDFYSLVRTSFSLMK